jgi:hypothetical protein
MALAAPARQRRLRPSFRTPWRAAPTGRWSTHQPKSPTPPPATHAPPRQHGRALTDMPPRAERGRRTTPRRRHTTTSPSAIRPIQYQLRPRAQQAPGEPPAKAHHQATTRESPDTKLVAKWRYHSLQWHGTGWKVGVCRRFTAQPDPRWYAWTQ